MKSFLLGVLALSLAGCVNLKVEWTATASYTSANAKPVEPGK